MAPKPKPLKRVKKFGIWPYMFEIQEAGPIREPILGLYIGDGTNSRYCAWFSNFKVRANDWALMHDQELKKIVFSGLTGYERRVQYEVPDPITIDELVPKNNRTQIGIAKQMKDSFLVRFIISYNNDENRHNLMVEYPGVAPGELFGKPFWGRLVEAGNVPAAVSYLFPTSSGE